MRGRKQQEKRAVSNPPEAFPSKPGQPPEYLDRVGKAEYQRLSEVLEKGEILGKTDPRLIELYALNYSLLLRATIELQEQPLTMMSKDRMFVNPTIGVIHNTTAKLSAIQNELGLTPASNQKIEIEAKKASGLDEFLKEFNAPSKKG